MATMYVYNIPTNETVNLRKSPSSDSTILIRVGYGKAVQASYYNSTWHSASFGGKSGYIMSKFLSATDPNGGGSGSVDGSGGTPTAGVIKGTSVRVRSQPNTTSTILTQVNTGDKITYYSGKTYSGSGYTWYRCTGSKWSGDGYIATNYVVKDDGSSGGGNLTIDQYINNLESYCNCGWKYGAGYNLSTKVIDCAYYSYMSRNQQGGHGCTTEYNSYLSSKGSITGGYDSLVRGMEVFQDDPDPAKKGYMGVYAGKVIIAGTLQHAVYQSCSSHNTIDAKYPEASGPNLTGMNSKWKYWGWSKYVIH